jgi:hypothetical protein
MEQVSGSVAVCGSQCLSARLGTIADSAQSESTLCGVGDSSLRRTASHRIGATSLQSCSSNDGESPYLNQPIHASYGMAVQFSSKIGQDSHSPSDLINTIKRLNKRSVPMHMFPLRSIEGNSHVWIGYP